MTRNERMWIRRRPDGWWRVLRRCLMIAALATLAAGCTTTPKREPMTLDQVITLSKQGMQPADIINQLKDTRTVFELSGSQYAKLKESGVDDSVLDYIQRTFVTSVEFETRMRYQSLYWGWGWGWPARPFYGPWPYWYW